MTSETEGGAASRIYRSLLALYPGAFRDEYRTDMVQLFEDQCRDEPAWHVCARSLLDLAITLPAQHLEVHVRQSPAAVVSTMYLTIAAAGMALATVGGTSRTSLLIGLVMAFGSGYLGIAARRGAAPAPRGTLSENWWKFILASPMLIGAVVLAAGLGVQAWFLGIATVLVAIALFISGVVLGVAHLFHRRTGLPAA